VLKVIALGAGIRMFPLVRGATLGIELFVARLWLVGRVSLGFGSSFFIVLVLFVCT
jgi:hypothetical protein